MFCFYSVQVCSSVPEFPDCFGVSGSRGGKRGPKLHSHQQISIRIGKEKRQEGV